MPRFHKLPSEIILSIASYLSHHDLCVFRQTCRQAEQQTFDFWAVESFTTIQILLSEDALRKLRAIARNARLRNVVRYLRFICPLCNIKFLDLHEPDSLKHNDALEPCFSGDENLRQGTTRANGYMRSLMSGPLHAMIQESLAPFTSLQHLAISSCHFQASSDTLLPMAKYGSWGDARVLGQAELMGTISKALWTGWPMGTDYQDDMQIEDKTHTQITLMLLGACSHISFKKLTMDNILMRDMFTAADLCMKRIDKFANLTDLCIEVVWCQDDDLSSGASYRNNLGMFLNTLTRLERLDIRFDDSLDQVHEIMPSLQLHNLTSLSWISGQFNFTWLLDLLYKSRVTLTSLHIWPLHGDFLMTPSDHEECIYTIEKLRDDFDLREVQFVRWNSPYNFEDVPETTETGEKKDVTTLLNDWISLLRVSPEQYLEDRKKFSPYREWEEEIARLESHEARQALADFEASIDNYDE